MFVLLLVLLLVFLLLLLAKPLIVAFLWTPKNRQILRPQNEDLITSGT